MLSVLIYVYLYFILIFLPEKKTCDNGSTQEENIPHKKKNKKKSTGANLGGSILFIDIWIHISFSAFSDLFDHTV